MQLTYDVIMSYYTLAFFHIKYINTFSGFSRTEGTSRHQWKNWTKGDFCLYISEISITILRKTECHWEKKSWFDIDIDTVVGSSGDTWLAYLLYI